MLSDINLAKSTDALQCKLSTINLAKRTDALLPMQTAACFEHAIDLPGTHTVEAHHQAQGKQGHCSHAAISSGVLKAYRAGITRGHRPS